MRSRRRRLAILAAAPGWLALLVCPTPCYAGATAAASPEGCDAEMPAYEPGWLTPARTRRLELRPLGGGALLYLGVEHTNDPRDPSLAALEREMRRFRPTLVLFEGVATATAPDRETTVERYGEAGFLRSVARHLDVPARSFDAGAAEQIAFLSSRFDAEEVKLFYVLREVWLLRDRQGRSPGEIHRLAGDVIAGRRLGELPDVLMSEADFAHAFSRRWPPGARWLAPRAAWFDPYQTSRQSGGVFTNDLERALTVYRDTVMYRAVAREVRRGERVFAVAGSGHLPVQAPALRCALGG